MQAVAVGVRFGDMDRLAVHVGFGMEHDGSHRAGQRDEALRLRRLLALGMEPVAEAAHVVGAAEEGTHEVRDTYCCLPVFSNSLAKMMKNASNSLKPGLSMSRSTRST